MRKLEYHKSINEALELCMKKNKNVIVIGLGVDDPKGIFGTTLKLKKKFGNKRVFDMPTAENGITGIAIGASLSGMLPVITHQRVEFSLLAMDQIVNLLKIFLQAFLDLKWSPHQMQKTQRAC